MNDRYSEEVKAILEAAQQQAVMNYHRSWQPHKLMQQCAAATA